MKNRKIENQNSLILIVLVTLVSVGGIAYNNVYKDAEMIKTGWFGNDMVTALFVVPAMLATLIWTNKGSVIAQLIWLGLLAYIAYNFAFYLFGASFNNFFLIYTLIFSLSLYGLVLGFTNHRLNTIPKKISKNISVKPVALFLMLIGLTLAAAEVTFCIKAMLEGKAPSTPTLIFALDLTTVVPNTILAAVLLWKRKKWGFILGTVMLVKSICYGLVLTVSGLLAGLNGNSYPFFSFYVFVVVGCSIFLLLLLKDTYHVLKNKKSVVNFF